MNVLSPCPPGWGMPENESLAVANEAVTSCYWPLYEVENGKYRLTYRPREKTPVVEWLRKQGRFRHLFEPQNEHFLVEIQKQVDQEWEELLELCGEK
ncbi:pyruvate ferredoxin oxidoreductase beta subunit [Candidatus Hakubella thermalkaliphila]|uniref:Pyruvate ferredoxin oxidoreductase beta subunit n=1 Tax=Candidatus Hakubella thermalkaliphila TaxID=2754717 RepID=A0A6V8NZH7_9ACTN|nr:pyruvate ferredoxin oxidoreductase beta subunit [Candidatus Hakubella thermalkaliphila]